MGKLFFLLILTGLGVAFAMGVRVYPQHLADYIPKAKPPAKFVAEKNDGTKVVGKLIYRDDDLVIINDGTRDVDVKAADLKTVSEQKSPELNKPKRKLYSYDPDRSLFKKYFGDSSKSKMPALKMPGQTLAETYTDEIQSKIGQGEHLKERVRQLS